MMLKKGTFSHGSFFALRCAPHETLKVAVVVPKKIAKTAVVRNRIRRRVYAVVEQNAKDIEPAWYVFSAKSGVATASFQKTHSDILSLLSKCGGLKAGAKKDTIA